MERLTEFENISKSKVYWASVEKSWPEISVVNKKDVFGESANVCVVLSPLYAQGDLRSAGLIKPPFGISESRVAGKILAYKKVLESMSESIRQTGYEMNLLAVLADKGVLFHGKPGKEEDGALEYHCQLYNDELSALAKTKGFNFTLQSYSGLGVKFPTFVDLSAPIPSELVGLADGLNSKSAPEYEMITLLNEYFNLSIAPSKKNRHVVERVLSMNGMDFNGAFWLIAGYLAFDAKIPEIAGANGIYLVAERLEPMFGISRFTEKLKNMTRIQLKA